MAKKKKQNVRICEICQDVRYMTEEQILQGLNRLCITRYAYILHDKDVYDKEDEKKNPDHKAGTTKAPHWHVMIKLSSARAMEHIAKWFGVKTQYVKKSTSGRFDSMALYLIHYNDFSKYQYDPKEVKASFNYLEFVDKTNEKAFTIEEVIEMIDHEVIRKHNFTNYISCTLYTENKSQIETAFKYVADRNQSVDHKKDVIFISGESGSGKTYFAKEYAKNEGMSIYISEPGTDIAGGYKDQDVIVLDDYRLDDMSFSNLLKVLDNNTCTTIASRYSNKSLSACKLIIITSIFSPDKMFGAFCTAYNEPIEQIKRRCKTWIDMDEKHIRVYDYKDELKDYQFQTTYRNAAQDLKKQNEDEGNPILEKLNGFLVEEVPSQEDEPKDDDIDKDTGEFLCPF